MGINEIDHTIYPYMVGREDCRVLPRSFKTLAEAEGYLAKQDKAAVARASHAAARSRSGISSSASVSLLTIACRPNVTPSSARSRLIFSATAYGFVMRAG